MIALYQLEGVVHRYQNRPVLRLPRLEIAAGAALGLVGPNGSGKSTLLRLLAFLMPPSAGRVVFDGQPDLDPALARRQATLLLQDVRLLKRSVLANVTLGLRLRGETEALASRASEALDLVGLAPDRFLRRSWLELSGGEAARVALASRLILRPRVLLLDEPTNSLDAQALDRLGHVLDIARREWGTTLVLASHDRAWLSGVVDSLLDLGTDLTASASHGPQPRPCAKENPA